MSSTAATSYYAYATLTCHDPAHCEGNEKSRYAGTIAITASMASVVGMMALGHLQKLSTHNGKLSLLLWMLTRSMSAIMLLVGGQCRASFTLPADSTLTKSSDRKEHSFGSLKPYI